MSASLVGSEMCIRDRAPVPPGTRAAGASAARAGAVGHQRGRRKRSRAECAPASCCSSGFGPPSPCRPRPEHGARAPGRRVTSAASATPALTTTT
eukprot:12234136-Alexandrium_andersonii.AAC.1